MFKLKYLIKIFMIIIFAFIFLEHKANAQDIENGKSFKVIGYFLGKSDDVDKFDYAKLSHIIFCFTDLDGNKIAFKDSNDESTLKLLVEKKKKYKHLKIMIALGGWKGCATCSPIFSVDSNRKIFAQSVKIFIDKYNLDGIDVDWESPVIGGYTNHPAMPEDKENFTELMKELRIAVPKPLEISFDANSFAEFILNSVDWGRIIEHVDFVNLMTYGLPNDKPRHTGHHSALYSSPYQYESVDSGIKLLDSLKVPLEKIIIGAAFYGFVVQNVDSVNFGLGQIGKNKNSPYYRDIIEEYSEQKGYKLHWDTTAMAPFLYSFPEKTFITFDNKESVTLKTKYALEKHLGGIMFWKLNGDSYKEGLLDAIYNEVQRVKP